MNDTNNDLIDGRDNLTRLLNLGRRKHPRISRLYSSIVYYLRFVLPVIALGIVAIVMAWPKMDSEFAVIQKKDIIPQNVGRNELIDPHFESATESQNPYVITAARAVQDMDDPSIVLLQSPVADVTMAGGGKISARAASGIYRQNEHILILNGAVRITDATGFILQSQKMNISVDDKIAWTDTAVHGEGPSGTLEARAMNANNATGIVVFTGPAKLVLKQTPKDLSP